MHALPPFTLHRVLLQIQMAINAYYHTHRTAATTPGRFETMVRRSSHMMANLSTQVASIVRLRHKATNQQLAFSGIHVTANYFAPYLQVGTIPCYTCMHPMRSFQSLTAQVMAGLIYSSYGWSDLLKLWLV